MELCENYIEILSRRVALIHRDLDLGVKTGDKVTYVMVKKKVRYVVDAEGKVECIIV